MSIELFFGNTSYQLLIGHKTPCWGQLAMISLTKIYFGTDREVEFAESIFSF